MQIDETNRGVFTLSDRKERDSLGGEGTDWTQ